LSLLLLLALPLLPLLLAVGMAGARKGTGEQTLGACQMQNCRVGPFSF
jgi:hypothetical protein